MPKRRGVLARQEDVLRHAERRHDVEFLVHEAQAERRGIRGPRQAPRRPSTVIAMRSA
jgi:hypothetical protein